MVLFWLGNQILAREGLNLTLILVAADFPQVGLCELWPICLSRAHICLRQIPADLVKARCLECTKLRLKAKIPCRNSKATVTTKWRLSKRCSSGWSLKCLDLELLHLLLGRIRSRCRKGMLKGLQKKVLWTNQLDQMLPGQTPVIKKLQ